MEYNDKEWTYYSTLVSGYTEKYGMRGMRDRNKRLLKSLKKTKRQQEKEKILSQLAENNLPLAKYCAERYRLHFPEKGTTPDDDFQECCEEMVRFLKRKDIQDLSNQWFQVKLYYRMYSKLYVNSVKATKLNPETVPFSEETFLPDEESPAKINKEFLKKIIDCMFSGKKNRLLTYFLFGKQNEFGPFDYEAIGMCENLTSGAVRLNTSKSMKKMLEFITVCTRNGQFHIEDLLQ